MEAPAGTLQEQVVADLDRLEERLDQAAALVKRLRAERDALAAERDRQASEIEGLRGERERICREAGVRDLQAMLGIVARWKSLEEEQRWLLRDREAIGKRLGALLEKVDLLAGGS